MSKTTAYQRLVRQGQPYTVTRPAWEPHVEEVEDGEPIVTVNQVFQVTGFTLEYKLVDEESGEWLRKWEEHDLGRVATRKIANDVAAEWRESLVGQYDLAE